MRTQLAQCGDETVKWSFDGFSRGIGAFALSPFCRTHLNVCFFYGRLLKNTVNAFTQLINLDDTRNVV